MILLEGRNNNKMAKYFNYFPTTYYSNANNVTTLDTVTNIIARFQFEESLKNNTTLFYPYDIQDGDTPELVASKYYGSPERHWIVLMFNNIVDPQYDWPLDQRTIIDYIDSKYSAPEYANNTTTGAGLTWAQNASHVKAYYKTVTRTVSGTNGTQIVEKIEIDANTHTNLLVQTNTYTLNSGSTVVETISKQIQTYYDYEIENNDNKRSIKLLRAEYVTEAGLINELKRVLKG